MCPSEPAQLDLLQKKTIYVWWLEAGQHAWPKIFFSFYMEWTRVIHLLWKKNWLSRKTLLFSSSLEPMTSTKTHALIDWTVTWKYYKTIKNINSYNYLMFFSCFLLMLMDVSNTLYESSFWLVSRSSVTGRASVHVLVVQSG
jgi:hypothetical protein